MRREPASRHESRRRGALPHAQSGRRPVNRDVLCIQENVAVVGWKQAGRAGIAIEGLKDEGRSGDKAKRG
jgi:hypothetical protein